MSRKPGDQHARCYCLLICTDAPCYECKFDCDGCLCGRIGVITSGEAMAWKHYTDKSTNTFTTRSEGRKIECEITIGTVSTGKSRVWGGYFCRVEGPMISIECEDPWSLHQAFLDAVKQFIERGHAINLYGLDQSFHESGLSANSGFGYVSGVSGHVSMIDEVS